MKSVNWIILVAMTLMVFELSSFVHAEGKADVSSDTAKENAHPRADYLGAVGIGVSDLANSTRFYQKILGLDVLRVYELGYINENVLGHADSEDAVLVLMNWPGDKDRRYDGTDVKIVFYVSDPEAVIQRIREQGGLIDREAEPHEAVNGLVIGMGRDPDNYLVEVIQK